MLKGHVFSRQLFGNSIFALFINTFTNGRNGVSNNYKNAMAITHSGNTITIDSGAVCIQGRFLEEDTSSSIAAGTDTAYCKLVVEVDLDKQNTESEFNQAKYKIVKSTTGYPNLTQNNIVKNNSGIYQYELARFRTSANGISDFRDMRTFLDFESIYDAIQEEYRVVLEELREELANVEDGSAYLLKNNIATLSGTYEFDGTIRYYKIPYPSGFTKSNCVIISLMVDNIVQNENYIARLDEDKITLLQNEASAAQCPCKIVLMKI